MLKEVHNKVHLQVGGIRLVDDAQLEVIFPLFFLLHDQVDGVAEDANLDQPLGDRPRLKAAISARFLQKAVAEEIVERIE